MLMTDAPAGPSRDSVTDATAETLAFTRAFVAVLLAERPGPLTAVQRDFLETIARRIDRVQFVSDGHETLPALVVPRTCRGLSQVRLPRCSE
jgi:hypothetical protein